MANQLELIRIYACCSTRATGEKLRWEGNKNEKSYIFLGYTQYTLHTAYKRWGQ